MTREQQLQLQLEEHRKAKNTLLDRVAVLPKLTKERDALWADVSAYVKTAIEVLAKGEAKETWQADLFKNICDKVKAHTLGELWGSVDKL